MTEQKIVQKFTGIVVSDKMAKTIVVRVDRKVSHPQYKSHTLSAKSLKFMMKIKNSKSEIR